jgi:hypothetical protein
MRPAIGSSGGQAEMSEGVQRQQFTPADTVYPPLFADLRSGKTNEVRRYFMKA